MLGGELNTGSVLMSYLECYQDRQLGSTVGQLGPSTQTEIRYFIVCHWSDKAMVLRRD